MHCGYVSTRVRSVSSVELDSEAYLPPVANVKINIHFSCLLMLNLQTMGIGSARMMKSSMMLWTPAATTSVACVMQLAPGVSGSHSACTGTHRNMPVKHPYMTPGDEQESCEPESPVKASLGEDGAVKCEQREFDQAHHNAVQNFVTNHKLFKRRSALSQLAIDFLLLVF